jgi:predicted RNase H-like HicB family nuclease
MKRISVFVEKTRTGFSACSDDYPVCTTGDDLKEIRSNMVEAMNLYYEETDPPKVISEKDLNLRLDLASFFGYYKVINAKAFSNRVGMNQSLLAQYIKGIKKPSKVQTQRILKGVQQLGRELAEISF